PEAQAFQERRWLEMLEQADRRVPSIRAVDGALAVGSDAEANAGIDRRTRHQNRIDFANVVDLVRIPYLDIKEHGHPGVRPDAVYPPAVFRKPDAGGVNFGEGNLS